jgi:hypothetical protein
MPVIGHTPKQAESMKRRIGNQAARIGRDIDRMRAMQTDDPDFNDWLNEAAAAVANAADQAHSTIDRRTRAR